MTALQRYPMIALPELFHDRGGFVVTGDPKLTAIMEFAPPIT